MKKILIIISLFLLIVMDLLFIFLPNLLKDKNIINLENEVTMVDNYIYNNIGDIDEINMYISKKITTGKMKKIESSVDSYLSDLLSIYLNINDLDKDLMSDNFSINFSKDEINSRYDLIINYIDVLNKSRSVLYDLDEDDYFKLSDEELVSMYNNILKKIDKTRLINQINIYISNLNDKLIIFDYLKDNNNFFDMEENIVFNKRSKYNDFNDVLENIDVIVDYQLVNDVVGPVINANNISINEGDYLSLNDKISCIDDVDDSVACEINGSYNSNVVGVYTVNIKAKDSSGNESNKDINIIVKEKEKYNLPYIIEVIRNQSTTIVYGQDENGGYTKIVGVFPCSPGAGNNTPVGTFYSRRGYTWGGLFGGVYGQYSTIITSHVLFHSVPYHSMNKNDLVWEYYNRLGSKDSLGCVRLTVRDAKWIYDNCPSGTMIKIYDGNLPDGVSKPSAQKIDSNDERRGWDPTDPDPSNPWNQ